MHYIPNPREQAVVNALETAVQDPRYGGSVEMLAAVVVMAVDAFDENVASTLAASGQS